MNFKEQVNLFLEQDFINFKEEKNKGKEKTIIGSEKMPGMDAKAQTVTVQGEKPVQNNPTKKSKPVAKKDDKIECTACKKAGKICAKCKKLKAEEEKRATLGNGKKLREKKAACKTKTIKEYIQESSNILNEYDPEYDKSDKWKNLYKEAQKAGVKFSSYVLKKTGGLPPPGVSIYYDELTDPKAKAKREAGEARLNMTNPYEGDGTSSVKTESADYDSIIQEENISFFKLSKKIASFIRRADGAGEHMPNGGAVLKFETFTNYMKTVKSKAEELEKKYSDATKEEKKEMKEDYRKLKLDAKKHLRLLKDSTGRWLWTVTDDPRFSKIVKAVAVGFYALLGASIMAAARSSSFSVETQNKYLNY